MKKSGDKIVIGWREWVALPELKIPRIKVKVDTGAKSSALHASNITPFNKRGGQWVRFTVHPIQRNSNRTIHAQAKLLDYRVIKSSSGHEQKRMVIETPIEFMGRSWPIEVTLALRDMMGFRMLLGREAIKGRFLVDPKASFINGKIPRRIA